MTTSFDPLSFLSRRGDKWFLGNGTGLIYAPSFPEYLHALGFYDYAEYFDIKVEPIFTMTLLDEELRPVRLQIDPSSLHWTPAAFRQKLVSDRDFEVIEHKTATGNGALTSTLEIIVDEKGSESLVPRFLHLVPWVAYPSATVLDVKAVGKRFVAISRKNPNIAQVMGSRIDCASFTANLSQGSGNKPKWELLVVASPAVIRNDGYQRDFSIAVTYELRKGTAIHSEFLDGERIIGETKYADLVRSIITKLVESKDKTAPTVTEFTPPILSPARVTKETLLSNLFPAKSIPSIILSGPTSARQDEEVFASILVKRGTTRDVPAFILKSGRLFSFDDLRKPESAFSSVISSSDVSEEDTSEWLADRDKRRDLVRFLNLSLRNHVLKRPNIRYDKRHCRFWFLLDNGNDNLFTWRSTGGKLSKRVLAKKVFSSDGRLLYCWHNSAKMRFILLDDALFLKIEPTFTFTFDGNTLVPGYRIPSLMSKRAPIQYNNAYRDTVRLWAKWASRRDIEIDIPAGQQRITVDTRPASVPLGVGIPQDK